MSDPITLAVDAAGRTTSLCLAVPGTEPKLAPLDSRGRRNGRVLIPEAVALCERHGLRLADVGLVCVTLGPGSFTGLRLAVTFAKTLAFAAGCDAVGVPSHLALERLVQRRDPPGTRLRIVSDALRGDFYLTEVSTAGLGELPIADGPRLVSSVEGPGELLRVGQDPGGAADARTTLTVGLERWRAGLRDDPFALVPLYVRRSSAEETADSEPR
ncbi:tRNA (adenosine(37)-N6)-threonylcarbamoyltransferase complex dimerization subunit type 1 TsaB [Alienimonas californiensis]|uniref:tRNA threonylcarbamoyladenosine biosynthesis protein TsaB n=1 Tax=Alienimonas californiensis TaxID=2527989 RepID=A0A517PDR8_9PLAN|nr:tRNA (adenosine(37)-N6)-threonylcarbamoyltransferase complex dimerization subunit type 1 TsaB [Alienimonas californiensis]QDT17514.1 tRNA threonylcarbamoyladenosine biosynthesis protein TsaB [Alienimonas californiensis]